MKVTDLPPRVRLAIIRTFLVLVLPVLVGQAAYEALRDAWGDFRWSLSKEMRKWRAYWNVEMDAS